MTLSIIQKQEDNQFIFDLVGDLDAEYASSLHSKIENLIVDNDFSTDIVLNFDAVNFLDSTGIGVIIQGHKKLKKSNKSLILANLKGQPLQTINFLKLDKIMNIQ